jgi:hypothetical protein
LLSIPIPQDTILYTGFVKSNREVDFYAGIIALDCTPIEEMAKLNLTWD